MGSRRVNMNRSITRFQVHVQCFASSEEDDDDPFYVREAYCKTSSSTIGEPITSSDSSPLTSPDAKPRRRHSLSISSSFSSIASSGRAGLRTSSKNLTSAEALGLFRRSAEILHLSKDTRVVEQAIYTMRALSAGKVVTYHQVLEHDAIGPVSRILMAHVANSSLSEEICRFLAQVFEKFKAARKIFVSENGIQSLRAVMENHFELYCSTVEAAMKTLSELCREGHIVRTIIFQSRTLEWIMVCVRQWRTARALHNTALQCLERAVMREKTNKDHVVSLGVVQELLYLLHQFDDDCVLLYRCIKLLNTIIEASEEHTQLSLSEGVVERVIHSLRLFPHKLELVACASRAVELLCHYGYGRQKAVDENCAEVLIEAFQQTVLRGKDVGSSSHRKAAINCVAAFEYLSLEPTTHVQLFQTEPINAVGWTASQYEDYVAVGEAATSFFRTITREASDKSRKSFFLVRRKPNILALEQILRTAVSILSKYPGNRKIADKVCNMLLDEATVGHIALVKSACPNLQSVVQQVVELQPAEDELINVAVSLVMRVR